MSRMIWMAAIVGILATPMVAVAQQSAGQPTVRPPATGPAEDFIPMPRGTPDGRISGGTRGIHPTGPIQAPATDPTGLPPRRSITGTPK